MLNAKIALTTLLEIGGIVLVAWGLWQIYPPVAWIAGGTFAILVAQGIIKPGGYED